MAILDRKGKLFGKISVLDLGAIAVILLTLVGVFLIPGNNGNSIAQLSNPDTKPVEVDIMVRGLTVLKPNDLVKAGDKTNIIIRNQPRGEISVKKVVVLVPKIPVPKLDGTLAVLPDPRLADTYVRDFAITLSANAQVTNDGVIFASDKIKVGTPIDIEGPKYIIRGSVMDVRY
jgi:Domain of unknown function (DUF4330)